MGKKASRVRRSTRSATQRAGYTIAGPVTVLRPTTAWNLSHGHDRTISAEDLATAPTHRVKTLRAYSPKSHLAVLKGRSRTA